MFYYYWSDRGTAPSLQIVGRGLDIKLALCFVYKKTENHKQNHCEEDSCPGTKQSKHVKYRPSSTVPV